MKIRIKILSGFALIIAMLAIAGMMSIYEFSRLGKTVNALIEDNYKSLEACKIMIEALEREDSGILLLISGQWKEGREILKKADSTFYAAFTKAKNNVTEIGEDVHIDQIEKSYTSYKELWERPIVGTKKENSIGWYFSELHPSLLTAKTHVESLMSLNQRTMYIEATLLKEKSRRAIMPGIVAIIGALVFLVIFNFFIGRYYVRPIKNLIKALKNTNSKEKKFDAKIYSNDEFKDLENEIQNLIYRIK